MNASISSPSSSSLFYFPVAPNPDASDEPLSIFRLLDARATFRRRYGE